MKEFEGKIFFDQRNSLIEKDFARLVVVCVCMCVIEKASAAKND